MEYGLGPYDKAAFQVHIMSVLILVLMEYGLGQGEETDEGFAWETS